MKTKIITILCCAFICIATMTTMFACNNFQPKTFTSDSGISITLDTSFSEQSFPNMTYTLVSDNSMFMAQKENFDLFTQIGISPENLTEEEYAQLCVENNHLNNVEVCYDETINTYYFEYNKTVSTQKFYYYATVKKGSDAFWLNQFACLQSQKPNLQNQFVIWAGSILVN